MTGTPTEPGLADPLRALLQRTLGAEYEVRGLLGKGGFGLVYAAHDWSLKRDVAVKVLRPDFQTFSDARERFRREAESVARLRHPHVMPIYAVRENDHIAFIIMPLVTGQSLTTHLRSGPMPFPEVRRILSEAAEALSAAHAAGIVHRDIKPDNILLDGDRRRVLLTDFGIAKALDQATERLTQTGTIIGSPQYMSPEQAGGDPAIDHRTDLYSLGIVGYEMLTGQLPFSGPTLASILVKHLGEEAPPVTRGRPDCPSDLAAVVARCLAKVPEERWASAEDLARALETASSPFPRASGDVRTPAAAPVALFRRRVIQAGVIVAVTAAADALMGRVLLTPIAVIITGGVMAAQFGTLWRSGYSWADVLSRRGVPGKGDVLPDSAEFGIYAEVLRQARSDRAAMLNVIGRVPRSERARFRDLIPAADGLIGRATELARQHHELERQIDPGPEELERRAAALRAEPASPGRNQRLATVERRRDSVIRLAVDRDRVRTELDESLAQLRELQNGLDRARL